MKKIALLFMFLCVGALNGMELEQEAKANLDRVAEERRANFKKVTELVHELAKEYKLSTRDVISIMENTLSGKCTKYDEYTKYDEAIELVRKLASDLELNTLEILRNIDRSLDHENYGDYKGKLSLAIRAIKGPNLSPDEKARILRYIKEGADVNYVGVLFPGSPLQLAIILSNLSVVEILLKSGATVTDETLSLADNMKTFTHANRALDSRLQYVEAYKRVVKFRAETAESLEIQKYWIEQEEIIPLIVQTLKNTKPEDYKTSSDNAVEIYELLSQASKK